MTEAQWLACTSPHELLHHIRATASHRKLRLFACACCRPLLGKVEKVSMKQKLTAAERFADGLISAEKFHPVFSHRHDDRERTGRLRGVTRFAFDSLGWRDAEQPNWDFDPLTEALVERPWEPGEYAEHFTNRVCLHALHARTLLACDRDHEGSATEGFREMMEAIRAEYAVVFRDIFGNPFRPVTFSQEWRTDTVVALARQMYDSRAFDRMPILADALQDAGCDSEDVLDHCRGEGPHVRGCWVVDLVLGKE
jgi:hypothetical protein